MKKQISEMYEKTEEYIRLKQAFDILMKLYPPDTPIWYPFEEEIRNEWEEE